MMEGISQVLVPVAFLAVFLCGCLYFISRGRPWSLLALAVVGIGIMFYSAL